MPHHLSSRKILLTIVSCCLLCVLLALLWYGRRGESINQYFIAELPANTDVFCIDPNGTKVIVGATEPGEYFAKITELTQWDVRSKTAQKTPHPPDSRAFKYSPDGSQFLVGSGHHDLIVDVSSMLTVAKADRLGHTAITRKLCLSGIHLFSSAGISTP